MIRRLSVASSPEPQNHGYSLGPSGRTVEFRSVPSVTASDATILRIVVVGYGELVHMTSAGRNAVQPCWLPTNVAAKRAIALDSEEPWRVTRNPVEREHPVNRVGWYGERRYPAIDVIAAYAAGSCSPGDRSIQKCSD